MVGTVTARYPSDIVIEAVMLTTAVVLGITFFACTTKTDFTDICTPLLIVFGFVFSMCSILFFTMGIERNHLIWGALGAILFSLYLLVDTQMIVGGANRKQQLD